MKVTGKTKILGIFGYPVEHTLSPSMHNSAFKALGLDMCYLPFKVSPEALPQAINAIRALNILGVNITVPHKESVIPLLDELDKEALFIGAVNTVVNSDGRLKGYNTDGKGFISSLSEEGISIDGKEILIIGAGGAGRAISYYLSESAKRVCLYDIDRAKVENLVNDFRKIRNNVFIADNIEKLSTSVDSRRGESHGVTRLGGSPPPQRIPASAGRLRRRPEAKEETPEAEKEFDIIINATPLGLKPDDPLPLNPDLIKPHMVVCDLIYKKTEFLKKAESKGAKIIGGLGMLLWQGVLAFQLWTGIKPPVEVMRKALKSRSLT